MAMANRRAKLGRPWIEPTETKTARVTADWSPAPTMTEGISSNFDVLRRGVYPVSVCGWIGAHPETPAYCSTFSSCVWNSDLSIVGCCTTAGNNCAFYTSCIDLNSPTPVGDRADIYTCRGTSVCYLNTYPDNYHQWGCGAATWATTVATAYQGMGADLSLQIVFTGDQATGQVAGSVTSTSTSSPALSTSLQSSLHSSGTHSFSPILTSQSPLLSLGAPSTLSTLASQIYTASADESPPPSTSQSSLPSSFSNSAMFSGYIGVGIVGGSFLVLLGVFIFWHWKRRKERALASIDRPESVAQPGPSTILRPLTILRPSTVLSLSSIQTLRSIQNVPAILSTSTVPRPPTVPSPPTIPSSSVPPCTSPTSLQTPVIANANARPDELFLDK